jgi:hypothetical protein
MGLKSDVIYWRGLDYLFGVAKADHQSPHNPMATPKEHNPITYTLGAIRGNQGTITFAHQGLYHEFSKSLLPAGAN